MTKKNNVQNTPVSGPAAEDEVLFKSLRADNWEEFFGQKNVKHNLQIALAAAKKRHEAVEHILLYGPPGLGKTTLSHIIAKEMGVNIKITSGAAIERAGDLASILTNLENGDILFIDEIHRLNKNVEETLYPAMEDYALDIIIGKGPAARTLRLDLPHFTLIGATTRIGLLTSPLRDRFGVINRLSFYDPEDLQKIIVRAALKLNIRLDYAAQAQLAQRSRGTPRIALRLLKRIRDVAQLEEVDLIDEILLSKCWQMLEVDAAGLDSSDRRLIMTIIEKFNGGPVGISTLAAALSEDIGTMEEVLEPYLMQAGFLKRTPRGRVATALAFSHFGKPIPASLSQMGLI